MRPASSEMKRLAMSSTLRLSLKLRPEESEQPIGRESNGGRSRTRTCDHLHVG